jgi:hypothetical protein
MPSRSSCSCDRNSELLIGLVRASSAARSVMIPLVRIFGDRITAFYELIQVVAHQVAAGLDNQGPNGSTSTGMA